MSQQISIEALRAALNDPNIRNQLGMKYAPRARVSAPTSKGGTVYLSLRNDRASGSVFKNRDGGYILATTFGRGRSPLAATFKYDKKSVTATITYPFENDAEYKTVDDFFKGKIVPVPVVNVTTAPEETVESTEETPAEESTEVQTTTTKTVKTKAAAPVDPNAGALAKQAMQLVSGGLYPDINAALAAHKAGDW